MRMSLITSGVKTKLQGMQTSIANFSRSASGKLNQVAKIATGALVAGFAAAARSALSYAKEMDNLANKSAAGFEEFQKQAAAAKTVGVEAEKLADIYAQFNERVGEFLRGEGGELAPFFEDIAPKVGLTAESFAELSGPESFQLFYDTLKKVGIEGPKLNSFMEDAASDSQDLIPLLEQGGFKFQFMGDEAVRNGQIMRDATKENLKKAQVAIDNFKAKAVIKVGELIGGRGDFAGIKQLGAQFMQLMAKVGGWLGNAFLGAVKTLTMAMVATVQLFGEKLVQGFEMAVAKLKIAIAPVIESISKAFGFEIEIDTYEAERKLEDLKNVIEPTFVERFYKVGESLGNWKFEVQDQIQYWKKIADEQGVILRDTKDVEEFIRKQKGGISDVSGELKVKKALLEAEKTLAYEINGENYTLIAELKKQIADHETILSLMGKYDWTIDEATSAVDRQNAGIRRTQALYDALYQAKKTGDTRTESSITLQIKLHEDALEIQKKVGNSYEDAYETAYELYALKEGDFDLSGDISKEEEKRFKLLNKILEKQRNKKKSLDKEDSVLKRKLIPNYKDIKKLTEKTANSLKTSAEINDILNPKTSKVKDAQEKVKGAVEDTNYELGKSVGLTGAVKGGTDGVTAAENAVTTAIDASNDKRKEAIRLTDALKNAGGSSSMDINIKTQIASDLSEYIVPHLEEQTKLLDSIDKSLKC